MTNTQKVIFQSGNETISGFLMLPNEALRYPAVIAIHEWWGLNDWIMEQATNLAASGYMVFAMDLYRGRATTDPTEARKLKRNLPEDRAICDMKAVFDYLSARADVNPKYISAVGWSLGGGLALRLAICEPRLAACIVNYGALPTQKIELQNINAPVLGNFGTLDRSIPVGKVQAFEKIMNALGKSVDIRMYEGAGHAFENSDNKRGYRQEAAADAWLRTLKFLPISDRSR